MCYSAISSFYRLLKETGRGKSRHNGLPPGENRERKLTDVSQRSARRRGRPGPALGSRRGPGRWDTLDELIVGGHDPGETVPQADYARLLRRLVRLLQAAGARNLYEPARHPVGGAVCPGETQCRA